MITLDDKEQLFPRYSAQCTLCKNNTGCRTCSVYTDCPDNFWMNTKKCPKYQRYEDKEEQKGKSYSMSKCMDCEKSPVIDIMWRNGLGRCWFCAEHFDEWANTKDDFWERYEKDNPDSELKFDYPNDAILGDDINRAWLVGSLPLPEKYRKRSNQDVRLEVKKTYLENTRETSNLSELSARAHKFEKTRTLSATVKSKMKDLDIELKGGPGSGNFGHAGRPGKVGGSASAQSYLPISDIPKEFSITNYEIEDETRVRVFDSMDEYVTAMQDEGMRIGGHSFAVFINRQNKIVEIEEGMEHGQGAINILNSEYAHLLVPEDKNPQDVLLDMIEQKSVRDSFYNQDWINEMRNSFVKSEAEDFMEGQKFWIKDMPESLTEDVIRVRLYFGDAFVNPRLQALDVCTHELNSSYLKRIHRLMDNGVFPTSEFGNPKVAWSSYDGWNEDRYTVYASLDDLSIASGVTPAFGGYVLKQKKRTLKELILSKLKGGKGSGHFGHAGRPGEIGGSAPTGALPGMGKHLNLPDKRTASIRRIVKTMNSSLDTENLNNKWLADNEDYFANDKDFRDFCLVTNHYTNGNYDEVRDITSHLTGLGTKETKADKTDKLEFIGHQIIRENLDYELFDAYIDDAIKTASSKSNMALNGCKTIVDAINESQPIDMTLYRGVPVLLWDEVPKVGEKFDVLGVTSFTTSSRIALGFATGSTPGSMFKGNSESIIFKIVGKKKAINIAPISSWNQQEWLTNGQFTVKKVRTEKKTITTGGFRWQLSEDRDFTIHTVELVQDGTYEAKE